MTATPHAEIERKFDVTDTVIAPDLRGVHGIAGLGEPTTVRLVAAYLDTTRLDLARRRITLRRREGGTDAGWHLKVESGSGSGSDERTEHRCPLGDSHSPPESLVDLVRAVVRDRPLDVVARLTTTRTETPLVGTGGEVLAVLCDDHVDAEAVGTAQVPGVVTRWREWEVELVRGDRPLLAAVAAVLVAAGARPGASSSKLAHALGARLTDLEPAPVADHPRTMSTAQLLRGRLLRQIAALEVQDRAFRAGEATGVHQMRVASRRLRSALTTFASILQDGSTRGPRDELRWLAGALGVARDAEVLHRRLRDELATLPPAQVVGPVADRIARTLQQEYAAGRQLAVETLTSPRYYRLLDALEAFADDLPVGPTGSHRATETIPELLRQDTERFTRAARRAIRETDPGARAEALHEARKKAKRLRYLAETAVPVHGRRAKKIVTRVTRVQETLGDHQDATVARERLVEIAARAGEAGEDTTTYDRLQELETAAAARAEAAYEAVLPGVTRETLPGRAGQARH